MPENVAFTIRLPADLAADLDAAAARAGKRSRQAYFEALVRDALAPGQLILGRWRVVAGEAEACADCGGTLAPGDTWLGATADGRIFGPVCGECARGD